MKMLASDFDGTLFFKDQGIKKEDIKKIKEFQAKGHLFGMSTGRDYQGIIKITDEYGIHLDFLVLASGSKLYDNKHQLIMNKPLDKKIITDIFKATQLPQEYMLFGEKQIYLIHPKQYVNSGKEVKDPSEIDEDNYAFLAIHFNEGEEKQAQATTDFINTHFKNQVVAYRNTINVDITRSGCSKGLGVLKMAEYLNISKEDIYVIGDSMNDIPMFDITNQAYSFYNIEEELKPHVNYFINSVAECIDHILNE